MEDVFFLKKRTKTFALRGLQTVEKHLSGASVCEAELTLLLLFWKRRVTLDSQHTGLLVMEALRSFERTKKLARRGLQSV
jgi:hypothetical protein